MENFLVFSRARGFLLSLSVLGLLTSFECSGADAHLSSWFANGLAGKKICFVGDSTTSNATALFKEFNDFYMKEGEPLYGVESIVNFGENGASTQAFLRDQVAHGITATIAQQADLYVISYGINDVRLGQATEDQLVSRLRDVVKKIRAGAPNADLVLRIPNSFLTTDVNEYGYVRPNASAAVYTALLSNAYKRLENQWDNVVVFDAQEIVFGRTSSAVSPNMADQLHPSSAGYVLLAKALVDLIGVDQSYDPVQAASALAADPSMPHVIYPRVVENLQYYNLVARGRWVSSSQVGERNGYVDLDWAANKAADIRCGDLVQMAENHVFALPSTCMITTLGLNTRIYNLGNALPAFTMTGGMVNVWRRK